MAVTVGIHIRDVTSDLIKELNLSLGDEPTTQRLKVCVCVCVRACGSPKLTVLENY